MVRMKCVILASAAAMTIAAGPPAEIAQNSDNRGSLQGWSSSNMQRAPKLATAGKDASTGSPTRGTAVPEPSNLLMLGLGVIGLIIGRMVARRRKKT